MIYTIKKGQHYCWHPIKLHCGINKIEITAMFDENCWYEKRNENDEDCNKLYGFSYGAHHKNSLRFSWKPDFENRGLIKIFSYTYNKGNRSSEYICSVKVDEEFDAKIEVMPKDKIASFYISTPEIFGVEIDFIKPFICAGYFLYPYLGGDNTAPNDMQISIT